MREDMERILLTEADIQARVEELGRQISRDFAGREPIFVGVLKGCFIFTPLSSQPCLCSSHSFFY